MRNQLKSLASLAAVEVLDKAVIAFRGRKDQKEALKSIPDWRDKLRDFVDLLIAGNV